MRSNPNRDVAAESLLSPSWSNSPPWRLVPAGCAIVAVACGASASPQPQRPLTSTRPVAAPLASTSVSTAIGAPADAPPSRATLSSLISQTMAGIVKAFNAHDAKKVASFYSSDSVVWSYGAPEGRGPDAIAKAMETYVFATFPDAREALVRAWMKGNVVILEMAWTGTMTGESMGMKPTRRPVGQVRAGVLTFDDDGLVKEQHEYGDDAGLMAQMTGKKDAPAVPILPTNTLDMHIANGTPDEDRLVDLAKAGDETFSKDDPKAVAMIVADDADYWTNISGGPAIKGKKDLATSFDGFFKAFPDQKWITSNAWGIDGFAIVEHTMTGTHKGALGALRASNKEVKGWHWLDIIQPTADAKIQHGWGYANLVELMQQTGQTKK